MPKFKEILWNIFGGDTNITSGAVGIGIEAPEQKLHVYGNSTTAKIRGKILVEDSSNSGAGASPELEFFKSRNTTGTSKEPVLSAETIGTVGFKCLTTNGFTGNAGAIAVRAEGTIGDGIVPAKMEFRTGQIGVTGALARLVIKSDGALEATQDVDYTTLVTQSYHLANKGYVDNVAAGPQFKRVTATQTSTSTTHANITELVTNSLAIGWYRFECAIIYQSAATTVGIGFRVNQGTAVLGSTQAIWRVNQAANGTDKSFEYDQIGLATNITSASTLAANTDTLARGDGLFNVTTAGTVAIQFRSETGGSVSVRANSALIVTKVG
jgi:hypothetical protein